MTTGARCELAKPFDVADHPPENSKDELGHRHLAHGRVGVSHAGGDACADLGEQASPRANHATRATRAMVNATGLSSDDPRRIVASWDGIGTSTSPAPASISAVTPNRFFACSLPLSTGQT